MEILFKIYPHLPNFMHNIFVSVYNFKAYKVRYGGNYQKFREYYYNQDKLSLDQLREKQLIALKKKLSFCNTNSKYYNEIFESNNFIFEKIDDLKKLPILNKENLRLDLDSIKTILKSKGNIVETGGTTGKSVEVIYTDEDLQERYAILDNFRSKFGYELGKKTAWLSGKSLLNKTDLKKHRFWK